MKIKKIVSSALAFIMVFMMVVAAIPMTSIKADAAYSPSSTVGKSTLTLDEIKEYIAEYLNYNFSTAEEMLNYELGLGYLDSSTSANGMFTIYVNRYTGFLYYRNNLTGQIITSNPIDPGYSNINDESKYDMMSQISVEFYQTSNTDVRHTYSSVEWASLYGQVNVTPIVGGLRVNYTLGDTSTRFLLPARLTAEEHTEHLLYPMLAYFEEKYQEIIPNNFINFTGNPLYDKRETDGYITFAQFQRYWVDIYDIVSAKTELDELLSEILNFALAYRLVRPNDETLSEAEKRELENCKPYQNGEAIMTINLNTDVTLIVTQREYAELIKKCCPDYNLTIMYEQEKNCGYVHEAVVLPYVRCALEYTFCDDGSLSVRVPANSINFDETVYTLEGISPLKFFGSVSALDEGFIFFPDGSGAVIDFTDFYNPAINRNSNISVTANTLFGADYCYSDISGEHREQITVPVYGLVGKTNLNESTKAALEGLGVTGYTSSDTGFFAVLEEGATLAKLNARTTLFRHKYASVSASYNPYPSDKYDLSKTLTVGNASSYTMTAKSKYTGSYVTRYTMLYDNFIGDAMYGNGKYCETSYVGMAAYYRNYLKETGTLTLLDTITEDLPLYIEVFGSMTIMTKVLTFPVEEEIPLTTFDDVITMYNEFATAKKTVASLIEKNKQLAEETENDTHLKEEYLSKAAKYEEILELIQNIKNINFKLTGFANDGMYYTYPTRASWQTVLGGDRSFQNLVNEGKRISKVEGQTFGVYPEFDFMYIHNTALGDGISQDRVGARMIDNRYASKQVYNAILQEFETFYTMLVSSDAMYSLYEKFNKDYSKYNAGALSVSTLGSDLNSNFDKDNSINRDEAREDVVELLNRMSVTDKYDLMIDKGNIYAVKYASHILNLPIDSSHFKSSSYTVPFLGMVLHGYVSYTGTPINYSGSTNYEILRSIESGAAPYYILCYDNTAFMKEDDQLNKYYGVSYDTWYDDILLTYAELNAQIGGLQNYEISDHRTVIAERLSEKSEREADYKKLQDEYISLLRAEIDNAVNAKFDELRAAGDITSRVKVVISESDVISQFRLIAAKSELIFDRAGFAELFNTIVEYYTSKYPGDSSNEENNAVVEIDGVENYESQYSFYTESCADDTDYKYTKYTLDNNKVVMVTYEKNGDVVRFVLNYNIYSVNVRIDGEVYTLDKYEYVKIEG